MKIVIFSNHIELAISVINIYYVLIGNLEMVNNEMMAIGMIMPQD